jgi:hypothetical protein
MNFLATLINSGTQVNKIINANSWSSCLAYCEGTGFDINPEFLEFARLRVSDKDTSSPS